MRCFLEDAAVWGWLHPRGRGGGGEGGTGILQPRRKPSPCYKVLGKILKMEFQGISRV